MRPACRGRHSARFRVALAGFCASMLGVLVVAAPADASPPQPVTCGQTITAPGQYFLANDCSGSGIGIGANDVRLRLAGHTMDGMGCSFSTGIASGSVAGLRIQGPGTITGYFVGISLNGANDSRVQKVTLSDDCDDGVLASGSRDQFAQNVATGSTSGSGFQVGGTDNRYVNNTADHNSGSGIALQPASKNNRIMGNQASNNGRFGIAVFSSATDNTIRANTADSNGSFDLADFNAGCDNNAWNGNHFGTANESCIN
jgi:parallel beta-helix repeat protein